MIRKTFFYLLTLALVAVAGLLAYALHWLHTPMASDSQKARQIVFVVKGGESLSSVSRRLASGLGLAHPPVLIAYARITQLTGIKRGEYKLSDAMSPVELLGLLNDGKVIQHFITLVEGVTVKDILQQLQSQSTLYWPEEINSTQAIAEHLQLDTDNPEGWLFPDTYAYSRGDSGWALVVQSHQRMKRILEAEWEARADGLPYKSAYEALVMASIVEKETGVPEERAEIAGVFVRRLQKGMRLQTDPTVIYGLGEAYDGNLTRKHLKQKTPYNTYAVAGLPPTPIANPGRDAIHAALHPADGDSLYFVARGDGTHVFSATLEAHQKAVRRFQLKRAADYRSSIR